jgi:hypothetical protein
MNGIMAPFVHPQEAPSLQGKRSGGPRFAPFGGRDALVGRGSMISILVPAATP